MSRWVEVPIEEVAEAIAIGVHTGLRKGTSAPDSAKLWSAISESKDSSWSDAASYAVWAMNFMGWRIQRKEQQ